jgi:hypothetical protein
MELFGVMVSLWRFRLHLGLAIQPRQQDDDDEPPAWPIPHLEPLEEPWSVVLDDDDDDSDQGGGRLGFK